MSYVAADADLRTPTVANAAVWAKFAGKPLEGYEGTFLDLAQRYRVDPNWALAYLQFESDFGLADPSGRGMRYHGNPWDILSYPGQWGQVGQYRGPELTYAIYPDVATGLEAGFRLWSSYADMGYGSWWASLSRAQCGNAGGCGGEWVPNVIRQGQWNAQQWPYDGQPYTGGPTSPAGASSGGGDGGSPGDSGGGDGGSLGGSPSGVSGSPGTTGAGPLRLGMPAKITLGFVAAGLLFTLLDNGDDGGVRWV